MGSELLQFLLTAAGFGLLAVLLRQWGEQRRSVRTRPLPTLEQQVLQALREQPPLTPAPPPPGSRQALDDVLHQAVLLQQHVPPRPDSRSHWGGRPRLAPGVSWPAFTAPDGTERALSFLVQVACDEVPAAGRLGVFPDTGVLQVFLDLDWGTHWRWRCLWSPGDPADFPEAALPATLPHAYGDRTYWKWPRDDADWPRLLPRWSFTPVLVEGDPSRSAVKEPGDDSDDETLLWPGTIDFEAALGELEGGVVDHVEMRASDGHGRLQRPFATFPHDWRAVTITLGHLAEQLDRKVRWVSGTPLEADEVERIRHEIDRWSRRAREHDPDEPVPATDADDVWQVLVDHPSVARQAVRDAVFDSVEATLAAHPRPQVELPDEAVALVRSRHALASRTDDWLHANTPDRMLSAPTCVQEEGWERVAEWLLLLEVSSLPGLGHEFGEGVLQFWIRPEDLAERRFDHVELTAEAY